MTLYEECLVGCQINWIYFATRHRKEEVDGAGALLKKELCKEQIKPGGQRSQNAKDTVWFLHAESSRVHEAQSSARRKTNKYFCKIKKD
jgi:hypothetical protein